MQSVLRPKRNAPTSADTATKAPKPKPRRRNKWSRHIATFVFAGVGLWLIGSVGWWHLQWLRSDVAKVQDDPAERITLEQQPLRR